MNWYYSTTASHTHVRVFMNHAKCGDLCFRNEEFEQIRETHESFQLALPLASMITFINETTPSASWLAEARKFNGKLCDTCHWTNTGCLNIGEGDKARWICHGCIKRTIDQFESASPAPAWIPVSTPPTEGDGLVFRLGSGLVSPPKVLWSGPTFVFDSPWDCPPSGATHWKPITLPVFPPSSPSSDETKRKAFEAWAADKFILQRTAHCYAAAQTECAWLAWQAAY